MEKQERWHRPPKHEVRDRLLTAAAQEFAAKGYAGTTLDGVAAAAGFSKGAVYSNFANKDDLFLALVDRRITDRTSEVSGSPDPGTRLMDLIVEEPSWQVLFVEFWLRCVQNPDLMTRFAVWRGPMRQVIAGFISGEADRRGLVLPLPADHLAVVILALSNGLGIERRIDAAAVPDTLLGGILGFLVKGMAP